MRYAFIDAILMTQKKVLFIILALFISLSNGVAQDKESKAEKFHQRALQYYNASAYEEAMQETVKALKADKKYINSWLLAGDIQVLKGNRVEAINNYKKAISIDSAYFIPVYYILGNLLFEEKQYSESIAYYDKYAAYPKIRDAEKARMNRNRRSAEFRLQAMQNPVPFNPVNLGPSVNTEGYEFVNYISPDRKRLYFTRRMLTGQHRDEQFYYSENIGDTLWKLAIDLGPPINTESDEGAMTLSPDGQYLFYSGCNFAGGFGSCDLYVSRLAGNQWTEPVNLGPVVNTWGWESQPSFSSDGRTLYFVSNRPEGKGSSDIWITHINAGGEWTEPYNAGDSVNTPDAERGPFIHPDGVTLYFSSKGHTGMGQGDLFVTKLKNDQSFSTPVNIGYPVNTEDDEVTMIVDNEGKYAYYSSARSNGFGLQDIYRFELPVTAHPRQVSYMKGIVYDSITQKPLQASIKLLDLETGDTIVFSNSNARDGSYLLVIPGGNNYALNVERNGYLFYSAHFKLAEETTLIDPFTKDIPLKPFREGEILVLRNIFFETDSFNLLPASTAELDHLLHMLKSNPGMAIQISGHTDNVGTAEYNQLLSEKRARSVYDYLVYSGIAANRLRYAGYGETMPLADNADEQGRAANRRTEMKIVRITP